MQAWKKIVSFVMSFVLCCGCFSVFSQASFWEESEEVGHSLGRSGNVVYTFEGLIELLGDSYWWFKQTEDLWPCGCAYSCEDGCACGEECTCPTNSGCDCSYDPSAPYYDCGCAYFCEDGCVCGDECECPPNSGCDCSYTFDDPYYDCGCAYFCEDGCPCVEECACPPNNGCDCSYDPTAPYYDCGCAYYCSDGCACEDECKCPPDSGCNCSYSSTIPYCDCGCSLYCGDDCTCGDACACGYECGCGCSDQTIVFGADIALEIGKDDYFILQNIAIDTGPYHLSMPRGYIDIKESATITGQGVDGAVVHIGELAEVHLYESEIAAIGFESRGGTAVSLEAGGIFEPGGGRISAHGPGAVGIEAKGNLSINNPRGRPAFDSLYHLAEMEVTGTGSSAVVAGGDVSLAFCWISAEGNPIRADGRVLLDSCYAPGASPDEVLQRTLTYIEASGDTSLDFWCFVGEPLWDDYGADPFAADSVYENAALLSADGAEGKYLEIPFRAHTTKVDTGKVGITEIPLDIPSRYHDLGIIGSKSPMTSRALVVNPAIPNIRYVSSGHNWNSIWVVLGFFGADYTPEHHQLMISRDDGKTWREYPRSGMADYGEMFIEIPYDESLFPATFKMKTTQGESFPVYCYIDGERVMGRLPTVGGDRIGDRDGSQTPPGGENADKPDKALASAPSQVDIFAPAVPQAPTIPAALEPAPEANRMTALQAPEPQAVLSPVPALLPEEESLTPHSPDLSGMDCVAMTGRELTALLSVKGEYIPFRKGDVAVLIPSDALASLSIGEEDTFGVYFKYEPARFLTIEFLLNSDRVTEFEGPFLVSLPWDGQAISCTGEDGSPILWEYREAEGILVITMERPGTVLLAFEPQPLPLSSAPPITAAEEDVSAGKMPVSAGTILFVLGVAGASVGGFVLLRRRRRLK